MNGKIGLFDSGLGGLSILKSLIKELPNEDYLFYEDSINNPYGNKSEEELLNLTTKIVDYLKSEGCKIIVIACNTATTSCIIKLREIYPDTIFVGTVPAIKVAYDGHYKNVINLSTPYTKNSKRVEELLTNFTNEDETIYNISGENLANLIEFDKKEEIMELLERLLSEYKDKSDALILGCTHYSLIKDEFKKVLPNTELLDGVKGVTAEVKKQLTINNLLNPRKENGTLKIINNKSEDLISRSINILNKNNEGNMFSTEEIVKGDSIIDNNENFSCNIKL